VCVCVCVCVCVTAGHRGIASRCASLREFPSTPWLPTGHAQTVFANTLRAAPPAVRYRRSLLTMADGGEVAVDWAAPPAVGGDVLLLLHGLTGGSHERYVQWMVHAAVTAGLQCCVMNARGCSSTALRTHIGFTAAATADAAEVLRYVRTCIGPTARIFAAGFSLGAGVLIKTLADTRTTDVCAAAALCTSFDHVLSMQLLEQPLHRLTYNRLLTSNLVRWLRGHEAQIQSERPIDIQRAYTSRTVREFDERVVVPKVRRSMLASMGRRSWRSL
jgi:predicted alpha/beta-fold hydrolase